MNELTPIESFLEKLKSRIRADVAELIPDEAIREMINTVIKEEFLTPKTVNNPGYSAYGSDRRQTLTVPCAFQLMVVDAVKPILERLAAEWVDSNQEVILKSWKSIVDEGVVKYVEAIQASRVEEQIRKSFNGVLAQLNEDRDKRGLSRLVIY